MRNVPHSRRYLNTWSLVVALFEEVEEVWLGGRRMSQGMTSFPVTFSFIFFMLMFEDVRS